tara:strand:+ start:8435 stop:10000 length:1566 start_codon:yes stop_codon:yes gene_type:complete
MSKINENIILHGGTYNSGQYKTSGITVDPGGRPVDSMEPYGNNNLRDLTRQFHESGKSPNQIYSILMGMGVPKDKATFACEQYIPKNNIKAKMATIQEKLDLKGKLETLHEEISNFKTRNQDYVKSVQTICEKYIRDCDKHSPSAFTRAMISELNNYNWMSPVADCITSVEKAMTDNTITVKVNEAYTTLFNNPQAKFYANAITDLGNLRDKSEEELRAEIGYTMNEHFWIPQIKAIVESVEALSGKMTSTSDGIITKKYSPILETKDGAAVHISGKVYAINENRIEELVYTLPELYITMIAVEESCNFVDGNTLTYSKGSNLFEFSNGEDGTLFKHNDKLVEFKDESELRTYLAHCGAFSINEANTMNMLAVAYNHVSDFVELDFVQSIKSKIHEGVEVNIVTLGDNVFINRINPSMNVNEMIKVDNGSKAVELVKEYVNYDISLSVKSLLEGEAKIEAQFEEAKMAIVEKINFLKEKKAEIMDKDQELDAIKEAAALIQGEINRFESDLNKLVDSKKKA